MYNPWKASFVALLGHNLAILFHNGAILFIILPKLCIYKGVAFPYIYFQSSSTSLHEKIESNSLAGNLTVPN